MVMPNATITPQQNANSGLQQLQAQQQGRQAQTSQTIGDIGKIGGLIASFIPIIGPILGPLIGAGSSLLAGATAPKPQTQNPAATEQHIVQANQVGGAQNPPTPPPPDAASYIQSLGGQL